MSYLENRDVYVKNLCAQIKRQKNNTMITSNNLKPVMADLVRQEMVRLGFTALVQYVGGSNTNWNYAVVIYL